MADGYLSAHVWDVASKLFNVLEYSGSLFEYAPVEGELDFDILYWQGVIKNIVFNTSTFKKLVPWINILTPFLLATV